MKRFLKNKYTYLLYQLLVMTILSAAAAFIPLWLSHLYRVCVIVFQWLMLSIAGAVTSFFVCRKGVNCYLGWILAPVCVSVVPWILIGYPVDPGVMLVCAFVSVIGAAAGQTAYHRI